jgi:hypothetical protein
LRLFLPHAADQDGHIPVWQHRAFMRRSKQPQVRHGHFVAHYFLFGMFLGPSFQKSLHSRQQFFFEVRSAPPKKRNVDAKKKKQNISVFKRGFATTEQPP